MFLCTEESCPRTLSSSSSFLLDYDGGISVIGLAQEPGKSRYFHHSQVPRLHVRRTWVDSRVMKILNEDEDHTDSHDKDPYHSYFEYFLSDPNDEDVLRGVAANVLNQDESSAKSLQTRRSRRVTHENDEKPQIPQEEQQHSPDEGVGEHGNDVDDLTEELKRRYEASVSKQYDENYERSRQRDQMHDQNAHESPDKAKEGHVEDHTEELKRRHEESISKQYDKNYQQSGQRDQMHDQKNNPEELDRMTKDLRAHLDRTHNKQQTVDQKKLDLRTQLEQMHAEIYGLAGKREDTQAVEEADGTNHNQNENAIHGAAANADQPMDTSDATIDQVAKQQNHTGDVKNDGNQAEAKGVPGHQVGQTKEQGADTSRGEQLEQNHTDSKSDGTQKDAKNSTNVENGHPEQKLAEGENHSNATNEGNQVQVKQDSDHAAEKEEGEVIDLDQDSAQAIKKNESGTGQAVESDHQKKEVIEKVDQNQGHPSNGSDVEKKILEGDAKEKHEEKIERREKEKVDSVDVNHRRLADVAEFDDAPLADDGLLMDGHTADDMFPDDPWPGDGEDYMGGHDADVDHGGDGGGLIDDELPPPDMMDDDVQYGREHVSCFFV